MYENGSLNESIIAICSESEKRDRKTHLRIKRDVSRVKTDSMSGCPVTEAFTQSANHLLHKGNSFAQYSKFLRCDFRKGNRMK